MGFTVSRQTASKLTANPAANRQKRLFYVVNRQKCRLRLTVKTFHGISNLTITGFWLLNNLYRLEKPFFFFISENTPKLFQVKGQENLQNTIADFNQQDYPYLF